jgi:hypothetical protein
MVHIYRVSTTNCAQTYELAQAHRNPDNGEDPNWQFGTKLTTEHVWDAFVLLSLLKDHEEQGRVLKLPHTGKQKDRFTKEIADHNEHIICVGQPKIGNYCEKCMRTYISSGELYKVEAAATIDRQ